MRGACSSLAVLLVLAQSACAHSPPAFRPAEVENGRLVRNGQGWVMQLSGTPKQRGKAAGELLREQIRWVLPRYLKATLGYAQVPEHVRELVRGMSAGIAEDHLDQLKALAESAGVDPDGLLVANLAPDLFAALSCSCLAVSGEKSRGGEMLFARNLDWQGGSALRELGLLVVESGAKLRFASVTWPGLVGVATGMNEKGLAAADLVVLGRRGKSERGVPVFFALRRAMETCGSVDEAADLLKQMKRTVLQNYMLADPKTAAALETGPGRFRRRNLQNGHVAVANHFDPDRHPRGRYAKLLQAAQKGGLGVPEMKKVLKEVALGDMNVQAVIFEPGDLVIHVSTRSRPAAQGSFSRLDLSPFFRGK
jgi:nucleotide-binding universal stress UspA family protein